MDPTDFSVRMPGDKLRSLIVKELSQGGNEVSIARKLVPLGSGDRPGKGDNLKRQLIRERIRRMIANDPRTVAAIHEAAISLAQQGVLPAILGMNEMAARGKMDAVRPLLEMTGVHNPKKQVEHSGTVEIVMNIPRPPQAGAAELESGDVIDAEVVEE